MLIYEYKVAGTNKQYAAIDEAIRVVQFIRNKCLRKWMDEHGVSSNVNFVPISGSMLLRQRSLPQKG